jgi:hypothetical protein
MLTIAFVRAGPRKPASASATKRGPPEATASNAFRWSTGHLGPDGSWRRCPGVLRLVLWKLFGSNKPQRKRDGSPSAQPDVGENPRKLAGSPQTARHGNRPGGLAMRAVVPIPSTGRLVAGLLPTTGTDGPAIGAWRKRGAHPSVSRGHLEAAPAMLTDRSPRISPWQPPATRRPLHVAPGKAELTGSMECVQPAVSASNATAPPKPACCMRPPGVVVAPTRRPTWAPAREKQWAAYGQLMGSSGCPLRSRRVGQRGAEPPKL